MSKHAPLDGCNFTRNAPGATGKARRTFRQGGCGSMYTAVVGAAGMQRGARKGCNCNCSDRVIEQGTRKSQRDFSLLIQRLVSALCTRVRLPSAEILIDFPLCRPSLSFQHRDGTWSLSLVTYTGCPLNTKRSLDLKISKFSIIFTRN